MKVPCLKMSEEMNKDSVILELTENEMISINEICRLCANQSDKLVPIFSEEGIANELDTKINLYLPIKVAETDELPLQCCWSCASTILAWHELVEASVEADRRLRSYQFVDSNKLGNSEYDASEALILDEPVEENVTDKLLQNMKCKTDADIDGIEMDCIVKGGKPLPDIDGIEVDCIAKDEKPLEIFSEDAEKSQEIKKNVEVVYSCQYCIEVFLRKKDLKSHVKQNHPKTSRRKIVDKHSSLPVRGNEIEGMSFELQHNEEKPCAFCTLTFKTQSDLDQHISVAHVETESKYDISKDDFSVSNIENHNEVSVIIDNSQFKNTTVLEKNIKNETELNIKEEPILPDEKASLAREELEKIIDPKTKACKICSLNFNKKIDLNKHLLLVHKVKEQRHRRKHSEIKALHFCDVCDKGFTRKYDMLKHRKNLHKEHSFSYVPERRKSEISSSCKVEDSEGNIVFKCDVCSQIFKQSYNLLRHKTIHTGVRSYVCEFCAKDFRTSSGLHRHLNESHYGNRRFVCEICDKLFKSRANRDEHMNIHTDTRPYVCDKCGKAFKQKASLHVHKMYHSDNFRFTCNICGNKYRRAQELKKHSWIHEGHKPFKCNLCNTGFRLKPDLKRHCAKNIQCGDCGELFCKESQFEAHLVDKHLIVD